MTGGADDCCPTMSWGGEPTTKAVAGDIVEDKVWRGSGEIVVVRGVWSVRLVLAFVDMSWKSDGSRDEIALTHTRWSELFLPNSPLDAQAERLCRRGEETELKELLNTLDLLCQN